MQVRRFGVGGEKASRLSAASRRSTFSQALFVVWCDHGDLIRSGLKGVSVASWNQFTCEASDLAAIGADRFSKGVAYLATASASGRPRVHPVSPVISEDDRLFVFMEPTSPKGGDLRRDGRYALHSAVDDSIGSGGEVFVRGTARLVEDDATRRVAARATTFQPEERYILFELGVDDVVVTVYENGHPRRTRWRRPSER